MSEEKKIERMETAEFIAHIFNLTLEQARNLETAYQLNGLCDEGIMGTAAAFGINPDTVREVFYALDAVARMEQDAPDRGRWWEPGRCSEN